MYRYPPKSINNSKLIKLLKAVRESQNIALMVGSYQKDITCDLHCYRQDFNIMLNDTMSHNYNLFIPTLD